MKELEKLDGSSQVVVCLMATKIIQYTRLKELCKKAKVISFFIFWFLIFFKSDEQILSQLEKCGILISGCWVVKSESMKLQPKTIIGRNYILSLLHQNGIVSRKEIQEKTDLKMEEIKDILSDICIINDKKMWQLKLKPDEKFMKHFPEIVYEQNKLWKKRIEL